MSLLTYLEGMVNGETDATKATAQAIELPPKFVV